MKVIGIIPSRYASSRFPGKPMARIGSMTMIERVWRQARKSALLDDVVVATDDERIANVMEKAGAHTVLTDAALPSGTDRCAQALERLGLDADVVVNVQGDEPFIDPAHIDALAQLMQQSQVSLGTLASRISSVEVLKDASKPKVVCSATGRALYFSRHAIPFNRDLSVGDAIAKYPFMKHIGLYAYKTRTLQEIVKLPPSPLEKMEGLEQLRWLEHGFAINVALVEGEAHGVDTPEQLQVAIDFLHQNSDKYGI